MNFPRMSLHIGDYLGDTGHLSTIEHGAYILLIMQYWRAGGLPDDDAQLAAIARMAPREWAKHKRVLQSLFRSGWKHKRIEAEFAEATRLYTRRVAASRKAAQERWRTDVHDASRMRNACDSDSNPNPNPNPNREEPKQEGAGTLGGGKVVALVRPVGGAA